MGLIRSLFLLIFEKNCSLHKNKLMWLINLCHMKMYLHFCPRKELLRLLELISKKNFSHLQAQLLQMRYNSMKEADKSKFSRHQNLLIFFNVSWLNNTEIAQYMVLLRGIFNCVFAHELYSWLPSTVHTISDLQFYSKFLQSV